MKRLALVVLLCTGCQSPTPRHYGCARAAGPIVVDGRLDESAWQRASWTEPFVDIRGGAHPTPLFETRAKLLWDDKHLYIAAKLDEPHVWATLRNHDEIVFNDPDFEIFLDPDGDARNYYEIEINALNTIFDLLLVRTYRNGGPVRYVWYGNLSRRGRNNSNIGWLQREWRSLYNKCNYIRLRSGARTRRDFQVTPADKLEFRRSPFHVPAPSRSRGPLVESACTCQRLPHYFYGSDWECRKHA